MTKRLYSLTVSGKEKRWIFDVWEDPKTITGCIADDVDIAPLFNTYPQFGIVPPKIWRFFQNLLDPVGWLLSKRDEHRAKQESREKGK